MIEVSKLCKSFGPIRAVDEVTLTVKKGEVLGFLGPNGAGKSTTMRMITGFLVPTSGSVRVGGHDVLEKPLAAKSLIGYLPESAPSYGDMTVREFLFFAASIRGLEGNARRRAIDRVMEMCFLKPVRHQSIDTLSKGYRHRTCFAQAILHDPPVLVLDEPTDGLDPNQKHEVRTLIREMGREKAILFSTHILEEVEAACSRAVIIDRGKVVANGTPAELKARSARARTLLIRVEGSQPSESALKELPGVLSVEAGERNGLPGRSLRLVPQDKEQVMSLAAAVIEHSRKHEWKLLDLQVDEGRLDDTFRAITLPDTVS